MFTPSCKVYNDSSYDPESGDGALGVEFAGTAVTSTSSFGAGITPRDADKISTLLVSAEGNEELQWSEGSYRGFFTITVTPEFVNATYFAMGDVSKYLTICSVCSYQRPFLVQLLIIWKDSKVRISLFKKV